MLQSDETDDHRPTALPKKRPPQSGLSGVNSATVGSARAPASGSFYRFTIVYLFKNECRLDQGILKINIPHANDFVQQTLADKQLQKYRR